MACLWDWRGVEGDGEWGGEGGSISKQSYQSNAW